MKRALLAIALVTIVGCDDKKGTTSPTASASSPVVASAAPSASAPPTPPASASAAPADEPVATEEDFEDEVSTTITEKNYESELDKLEKEIGK